MSKLLVVIGATGKQGGSVINAILADERARDVFRLRAVTRDPSSAKSRDLASRGVEVVAGDLNDADSIRRAFEGAHSAFSVTDYWAKMDKALEIKQGKLIADAAKAAGIKHFVYSTLLNTTKSTKGELPHIEHFDSKAEVADYIRESGIPASFYLPGFYMSNLPGQSFRRDENTGKFVFTLPSDPDAQIPLVDIESDTGKYVKAILMGGEAMLGKSIFGSPAYITPQEMVDTFAKVFPRDGAGAEYRQQPDAEYLGMLESFGMPENARRELLENMKLVNKQYGYYAGAGLDESNAILSDKAVTWEDYIKNHKEYTQLS